MGYGQLIWDIPKVAGIIAPEEPGTRAKVVEDFLKMLRSKDNEFSYIKKGSEVKIFKKDIYIYGYSYDGSGQPFFNNNEVIKNFGSSGKCFFLIRIEQNVYKDPNSKIPEGMADKNGNLPQATRADDSGRYYLYKFKGATSISGSRFQFGDVLGNCERVSQQTLTVNLFN